MREDKKERLQEVLVTFENMQNMIKRIMNGESESSLCKEYDIDNKLFRRLCFEPKIGFKNNKPDKEEIIDYLTSPEEKLYCEVFEIDIATNLLDVPLHLDEVVKVLMFTLTENEQQVLRYKYWEELTFNEIGDKMNITRSRACQLHQMAIKKLREPSRAWLLRYGKETFDEANKLREAKLNKIVSEEVASLEKQLELQLKLNDVNKLTELRDNINKLLDKKDISSDLYDIKIQDTELSNRTVNCLMRENIFTVGELAEYSDEQLLSIKAFGMNCFTEVKKLLSSLNKR